MSKFGTQGLLITKLAFSRNQRTLVISISVVLGVIILCSISYIIYLNSRVAKRKGNDREISCGFSEFQPLEIDND